ncbi:hypothetical protein [Flavobacterium lipolyticum]|uniref:Uncharacterized protein n=1 Tax=Flavobacterium lipolyticum TaxID=2893754 RepID=A0ABS8LWJ3_9FLAO|nr:hypothetical protein [Flavobacterium sp. F-126]MCC9016942.1 hypothetical protein [Flavobacterium sp. F-126]
MDFFNGMTNNAFTKYFLEELYSKTKFVQHDDSDEFFDPEQEYGKHIQETQAKLNALIRHSINQSGNAAGEEEETKLFNEKRTELFKTLLPEIDNYIDKIEVDYN